MGKNIDAWTFAVMSKNCRHTLLRPPLFKCIVFSVNPSEPILVALYLELQVRIGGQIYCISRKRNLLESLKITTVFITIRHVFIL
jgi:hypothetical protein